MEDSGFVGSERTPSQQLCIRPGKLKKVLLKNFMCHDHFEIEFNPSVNFIHGRNGSGKSAIATALVLGFGQRATATSRGVAVKSFIKRGRRVATIEITLYNCGVGNTFKHEKFGDEITTIRKIIENGGSQYRIRGKSCLEGPLTKQDLDSLLLHFNIQPQNPLCILSQDTARSFFKSRDHTQMYKLFMQGTQMETISESYQDNSQHRERLLKENERSEQELKKMYRDVVEADNKQEIALKLRDVENNKKLLDNELVWTKLKFSEAKFRENSIALEKATDGKEEFKKNESSEGNSQEALLNEKQEFENNLAELQQTLENIDSELNKIKTTNFRRKDHLRNRMETLEKKKKVIVRLEEDIHQLNIAVKNFQSKHSQIEESRQKIAELVNKIQETEAAMKTTDTYFRQLNDALGEQSNQLESINTEIKSFHLKKRDAELKLRQLKEGNSLGVYGHWMPRLLDKIEQAYQQGHFDSKPRGPIGVYIKVSDKAWAPAIESIMGKLLSSFCISSQKDNKVFNSLLEQVLDRNQNVSRPSTVISRFITNVHDYSRNEVRARGYRSLISSLTISDTVVANTLIDQMQIEQILLVPGTDDALNLMEKRINVPANCKFTLTQQGETIYPFPNYRYYSGNARHLATFLQTDVSQQIRETEYIMTDLNNQCRQVEGNKIVLLREIREIQKNLELQKKELEHLKNKNKHFGNLKMELERNVGFEPQSIQLYKNEIVEDETKKEALLEEIKVIEEEMKAINAEIQQTNGEQNAILSKQSQLNEQINVLRVNINNIDKRVREWHRRKDEFKRMLDEKNELVDEIQKQLEKSEKDYNNIKNIVEKGNIEEVQVERNLEVVQKDIHRVQAQIKVYRQELGGDTDQFTENHLVKKRLYENKKESIKQLKACIERSGKVLDNELASFLKMKTYQTRLANSTFTNLLKVRNIKGKLKFDFENKKLFIEAVPNVEGSSNQMSSLNSLSGGERSFVTTAFIRAIWSSMTAPFYVLDEFDVFTDLNNRTQIIQLLIDHARCFSHCQYLFITPLDLSQIVTDYMITVHVIRNPRDDD